MPLGPNVVLTRSAMAIAPMKEERRAFSPYTFQYKYSIDWTIKVGND